MVNAIPLQHKYYNDMNIIQSPANPRMPAIAIE